MLILDPRWLGWPLCVVAALSLAASRQRLFLAVVFGGVPLLWLVAKAAAWLIHRLTSRKGN